MQDPELPFEMRIYATSTMPDDFSNPAKWHAEPIQIAKQTTHKALLPTMVHRSIHFLLLVNAERSGAHVDQQEEPTANRVISIITALRVLGKTYTMERI